MTTTSPRGGGYAISESDYEYSDESEYSTSSTDTVGTE